MLRQLRRLEKTRGLVILFFIAILAVSLIVFYAPARNQAKSLTGSEIIASVGGEDITTGEVLRRREAMANLYGGSGINLAQLGIDEERILNGLVRDRIVTQEAARRGLGVSDEELGARIRELYRDESGQFIGAEKYKQSAVQRYGSVDKGERELRDALASEKLRAFVSAGVQVSPAEVEEQYKRQGVTFDIVYVGVQADKLVSQIKPGDDELKQYFEQRKTDYKVLNAQKKIRYLFLDQSKVGEKINISDEDLKKQYDTMSPELKRAGAKVQQIVFKVADKSLDSRVKSKADDVVKRARDNKADEKAFAELVRGFSEDPATKASDGNTVIKRKANPTGGAPDPLQSVLAQPVGNISDPIKSGTSYIVVRRGEDIPKTFDEAKQELLVSARNQKSFTAAADLARRAAEKLKQAKDVQKVAQEFAGEANMKAEDMVKETPFIAPGDNIPGLGVNQQFEEAIKNLNNEGDVGDQTQVPSGFAVPTVAGKRDANYQPNFDEVKDRVADKYKQEQSKNRLEQFAKDLISSAGSAGGLKAAAEKLGLEAKTNDKYKLAGSFDTLGNSPAADDALFQMKDGQVIAAPVRVDESYLVVALNKRTDADMSKFEEQKASLTDSALSTRRNQVFDDYISALEQKLKANGDIRIDREILTLMQEEAPPPPPAPPRRNNLPFTPPQ